MALSFVQFDILKLRMKERPGTRRASAFNIRLSGPKARKHNSLGQTEPGAHHPRR
jgi:hypothetical protein